MSDKLTALAPSLDPIKGHAGFFVSREDAQDTIRFKEHSGSKGRSIQLGFDGISITLDQLAHLHDVCNDFWAGIADPSAKVFVDTGWQWTCLLIHDEKVNKFMELNDEDLDMATRSSAVIINGYLAKDRNGFIRRLMQNV